jgi:hypothetical protein
MIRERIKMLRIYLAHALPAGAVLPGLVNQILHLHQNPPQKPVYNTSVSDLNPDPHSMGYWTRIRIANADPDPEGGKSVPKKKTN